MRHDRVTFLDRLTYHNRFTDKLMQISGMRNWRRDKRQMIPFSVSVKSSIYCGLFAAFLSGFLLALLMFSSAIPFIAGLLFLSITLSFVLTFVAQFVSNCGWNARAMKLNSQPNPRPKSPTTSNELLGELPEILR